MQNLCKNALKLNSKITLLNNHVRSNSKYNNDVHIFYSNIKKPIKCVLALEKASKKHYL